MKVLCCYADLYPQTARGLRLNVPPKWLSLVDVSGSPTDYWDAIREHWTGEDDLVIIEQDIEIHEDVLPTFVQCPEPWCAFSYFLRVGQTECPLTESLGCTKFSAEMQRMIPAELICDGPHPWFGLDIIMGVAFRKYGESLVPAHVRRIGGKLHSHVHGPVLHHHRGRVTWWEWDKETNSARALLLCWQLPSEGQESDRAIRPRRNRPRHLWCSDHLLAYDHRVLGRVG